MDRGGWVLLPVAARISSPNNRSNHTRTFIREHEDNPVHSLNSDHALSLFMDALYTDRSRQPRTSYPINLLSSFTRLSCLDSD